MTKQEEIREGIASEAYYAFNKTDEGDWGKLPFGKQQIYRHWVDNKVFPKLHSQDVAIKVNTELPENPYPEDIFSQEDILTGRVSAVKPLIEEATDD